MVFFRSWRPLNPETVGHRLFLAIISAFFFLISPLAANDVHVTLEKRQNGHWRVSYKLPRPMASLDLGPHLNGVRQSSWRSRMRGVEIAEIDGRDVARSTRDGDTFRSLLFDVRPTRLDMPRTYEAFSEIGPDGLLLFTGHFTPWWPEGGRMPARLSITPGAGEFVTAFGETRPRFEDWESPFENPAFVFVGPRPSVALAHIVSAADPVAPAWLKEEALAYSSEVIHAFARALGWYPAATPNFFLSFDENGAPGQAIFSGDALPAQFRMSLSGGAWRTRSPFAENILHMGVAHEAAHLWQTAARPVDENVPNWIHEGGANDLAAEIMMDLGYWTPDDARQDLTKARQRCIQLVRGQSLLSVEKQGQFEASYVCGQVINELASRRHPAGAVGFWKEFIVLAQENGGYDTDLFFSLAAKYNGEEFAQKLRAFTKSNHQRPDLALRRIEQSIGLGRGLAVGGDD